MSDVLCISAILTANVRYGSAIRSTCDLGGCGVLSTRSFVRPIFVRSSQHGLGAALAGRLCVMIGNFSGRAA
jgi:hypothetical protein